jgi:signal transduction histidine kinase
MSPETLKRVFEAHFTTRDNGSGLGLHFCAIAMERQGGSIKAESEGEGKGSTFVLELPRPNPRPVVMPISNSGQIPTLAGSQS